MADSSAFNPGGTGPASSTVTPSSSPTLAPPTTPAVPSTAPTTPAAPVTPIAPSTGPTQTTPPTVTPTVTPATPPTTPATPTPATAPIDANAPNIAVLRQSHEQIQRIWGEAQRLGTELDYTPESLREAFEKDPIATMQFLRQESTQHRQSPEYQEQQRIRAEVERVTKPLNEHFARVQADKHNQTIDTEFTRMFNSNEAFKTRNGVEAPPQLRALVHDRFIETIKWNNALLKEVVGGKVSGLQKVFDEVSADTIAAISGYSAWGTPTSTGTGTGTWATGPTTPPRAPNGQFTGTLDDIIEGTDKANVLPSMRGFK